MAPAPASAALNEIMPSGMLRSAGLLAGGGVTTAGLGTGGVGFASATTAGFAAGVVTVVPLVCFLEAGLRLQLATLGIVQYITPTMQFLLGVFVFHEHFDHERGITFVLIWLALAIYTLDALRQHRMRPSAAEAE